MLWHAVTPTADRMKLAGYTVKEVLYAVDETVVARAETDAGERVVLKYQDTEVPGHPPPLAGIERALAP